MDSPGELPYEDGHDIDPAAGLKERHPDWPDIKLRLLFGSHGTPEDMSELTGLLQDADVYFFEGAGDSAWLVTALQYTADLSPPTDPMEVEKFIDGFDYHGPARGTAYEGLIRALYGTRLIVDNCDIGMNDYPQGLTQAEYRSVMQARHAPVDADFSKTLENKLEHVKYRTDLQLQRDEFILGPGQFPSRVSPNGGRLEDKLGEIIEQHPDLAQEKRDSNQPIIAVATMGANHEGLFYRARAAGMDVECIQVEGTEICEYSDELSRKLEYGSPIDEEFLAKCYAEDIISYAIGYVEGVRISETTDGIVRLRRAVDSLSADDIKAMHKIWYEACTEPTGPLQDERVKSGIQSIYDLAMTGVDGSKIGS